MTRTVFVSTARLERWVEGFVVRHPGSTTRGYPDRVELTAPDGSTATLHAVFGPLTRLPATAEIAAEAAAALVRDARSVPVLRALLLRRGGYACAVVDGERVTASKVGTRYVQGRTAAGGWSQQRFARRREGQVHSLVGSATEVAVRILLPGVADDDALVTGGDRPLLDRVLADARLTPLAGLRRGPHLEIGDPRSNLVRELSVRARSVRIDLSEQPPPDEPGRTA